MRILVVIVNFGTSQLKYLEQVLNEYKSMEYSIDIIIHSNIPLKYENVEVKVFQFEDGQYRRLRFPAEQSIYDNKDNYDLFIFSENDHLITKKNIEAFLKVTKILPKEYIAGFFQYEKYEEGLFYPAYSNRYKWDKKSPFRIGDYVFAHFTNVHQASYVLTKEQLNQVIKNFDYIKKDINKYIEELNFKKLHDLKKIRILIKNATNIKKKKILIIVEFILRLIMIIIDMDKLKRFLLKLINKLKIKRLDFLREYLFEDYYYWILESAGSDIYLKCGFKKVIPISHFDDFLIYHLPNKYKDRRGKFDNVMRKDIDYLIRKAKSY